MRVLMVLARQVTAASSVYLGPSPSFYKLTGNMNEILDLTPVSYQARVKEPGARSTAQG